MIKIAISNFGLAAYWTHIGAVPIEGSPTTLAVFAAGRSTKAGFGGDASWHWDKLVGINGFDHRDRWRCKLGVMDTLIHCATALYGGNPPRLASCK